MAPLNPMHPTRWGLLVCWNVLAMILLLSLFSPLTAPAWSSIDLSVFQFLNGSLEGHPRLQQFWAMANNRWADWFEDLCILGFYTAAVYKTAPEKRKERVFQLLFCILITAVTIIVINRFLCRDLLKLRRKSPTQIVPDAINLQDLVPWISFKVNTSKSFPGDHATTALMFAFSYAYFVRGKLAIAALIYGLLLCLPRLVVGAHWISDTIVGSGAIVMLSLSWALCSPLSSRMWLKN